MRSRTRRLKSFWVVIARSFAHGADEGLTLRRAPPRRGAAKIGDGVPIDPGECVPFASRRRRRERRNRGWARDAPKSESSTTPQAPREWPGRRLGSRLHTLDRGGDEWLRVQR